MSCTSMDERVSGNHAHEGPNAGVAQVVINARLLSLCLVIGY